MERRIRLLLVTDQIGQQYKLKNQFENEGFDVVVAGTADYARQLIFQECEVVLCRTYINGAIPTTLIKECKQQEIPIAAMGSNPAHFAEWHELGVRHIFDSDLLMGSEDAAKKAIKNCSETLQNLVSKRV